MKKIEEKEEADRLWRTLPVDPIFADGIKRTLGIGILKQGGYNLNDAVKVIWSRSG